MSNNADPHPEVDLHEVLASRVRTGKAIHITGPLAGPVGLLHLVTINQLRTETGLSVYVIFS